MVFVELIKSFRLKLDKCVSVVVDIETIVNTMCLVS